MYAVPKEKYDMFLSGSCKGDVKYTRQINQLDVNDGGKVIIRNDDNIKNISNFGSSQEKSRSNGPSKNNETAESSVSTKSSISQNQFIPPNEKTNLGDLSFSPNLSNNIMSESRNQSDNNPLYNQSVSSDISNIIGERSGSIRNQNIEDISMKSAANHSVNSFLNNDTIDEHLFNGSLQGNNRTSTPDRNSTFTSSSNKTVEDSIQTPNLNETNNGLNGENAILPVLSENLPRIFTPAQELVSNAVVRREPENYWSEDKQEEVLLDLLPNGFFNNSSGVRDFNDVLQWTKANDYQKDIFNLNDEPMPSADERYNPHIPRTRGALSKLSSLNHRSQKRAEISPLQSRTSKNRRSTTQEDEKIANETIRQYFDKKRSNPNQDIPSDIMRKIVSLSRNLSYNDSAPVSNLAIARRNINSMKNPRVENERKVINETNRRERQLEFEERRGPSMRRNLNEDFDPPNIDDIVENPSFTSDFAKTLMESSSSTVSPIEKRVKKVTNPINEDERRSSKRESRRDRQSEFNERRGPSVKNTKLRVEIPTPKSSILDIIKKVKPSQSVKSPKEKLRELAAKSRKKKRGHSPDPPIILSKKRNPSKKTRYYNSSDSEEEEYKTWKI